MLGGLCTAVIVAMAPCTVRITTHLHAGEWAHVRPEHNWHGRVTYTFRTIPTANTVIGARTLADTTAHVYDTARYGEVYEYVCKTLCCPISLSFSVRIAAAGGSHDTALAQAMTSRQESVVLGLECTNWNMSLYMTQGSTLAISTTQTPTPLDFLAANNHAFAPPLFLFFFPRAPRWSSHPHVRTRPHRTFKRGLADGTVVDKTHVIESYTNFREISAAIQIVCR